MNAYKDYTDPDEEDEVYEPQVTSADPTERKLARALRIQRRIETLRKQNLAEDEENEKNEQTPIAKQIEASALKIEKLLFEGEEYVTNISVGNDKRESTRRVKDEIRREELIKTLNEEAEEAAKVFDEISRKWEALALYKDPLDIYDSVQMQKNKCNELIKQKDELIMMLRQEINEAEQVFTRDQDIQKDDVALLIHRIDKQVDLMRHAYRTEIRLLEDIITVERKALVEENSRRLEELQKKRDEEDWVNMERKIEQSNEFLEKTRECRLESEEVFRETKIAMETDSQVLQQELEYLKSFCLLNSEKLDYNYQILKKREDENILIKSQQKKLMNKLQDELNSIRKKIEQYKSSSDVRIEKLTDEIHKLRTSIFQVESKADQLMAVNDAKYKQVWQHNYEVAQKLVSRILTLDRIIHRQLLGLEWNYPKLNMIRQQDLPSYKAVMLYTGEAGKKGQKETEQEGTEIPESLVKLILGKIGDRAGFLIENRLTQILQQLERDEQRLIKVDNVFQTLGIESKKDMNLLMTYFMPYIYCPICDSQDTQVKQKLDKAHVELKASDVTNEAERRVTLQEDGPTTLLAAARPCLNDIENIVTNEMDVKQSSEDENEEEEETATQISSKSSPTGYSRTTTMTGTPAGALMGKKKCLPGHPVTINPSSVHRSMKEFINQFNQIKIKNLTIPERLARRRANVSRMLSVEDIACFWEQFVSFFPEHKQNLWDGLLFGLKKYYAILKDRHNINLETQRLRKQNSELKHLLKKCTPANKRKKSRFSCSVTTSAASSSYTRDI